MRDKYEISIWEDILVDNHYEEEKVAVIGSDTMTSDCKAYEPRLVENINGTNTFTFKMYYVYRDESGEKVQNPFLSLLVNERKIKALWKGKWYDFVIKNCQEDSTGKSITYTCKDLFINELSKNGFNLEFDTELENNQGTVAELAEKVLDGTDWQLGESDIIQQKTEESVYEIKVLNSFEAKNDTTGETDITIPADANILVFYSCVKNRTGLQFLYNEGGYQTESNQQLVINADCYSVESVSWIDIQDNEGTTEIIESGVSAVVDENIIFSIYDGYNVSSNYRGERLVRSIKSVLDPLTDKYVNIYEATEDGTGNYAGLISAGDIIYEYEGIEYKDPTIVNNLVVNSKDFAGVDGWINNAKRLMFKLYPEYDDQVIYDPTSYLRIGAGYTLNLGLRESSSFIPNGFSIGDKYIFRIKIKKDSSGNPGSYIDPNIGTIRDKIEPVISEYTLNNDGTFSLTGSQYAQITHTSTTNYPWVEFTLSFAKSITRSEIYSKKLGLIINLKESGDHWVEDVEFFPLVNGLSINGETQTEVRINPGDLNIQSIAKSYYHYYNHTTSSGLISVDDLKYLYIGDEKLNLSYVVPQYNENFEKIRSISAKQSNRFNLLQELAETFECWCKFEIKHDPITGRTIYTNGIPQKKVTFVKSIGEETGLGFVYGIDLNSVSRTIQSDQIVTKTIVLPNSNEFAKNGFCTIARSTENYSRDNFILNFDYYISHGLLNGNEINKDLYLSTDDSIGYYYHLNQLNTEYDASGEYLVAKHNELLKQQAFLTTYENYVTSLTEQINQLESELFKLVGCTTINQVQKLIKLEKFADNQEVLSRYNAHHQLINNRKEYNKMVNNLKTSIQSLEDIIQEKEDRREEIIESIKELNLKFYKKYSRFIQEGSWISEEYVDDNLYYLDAQSVAYTSSRPQVSYSISVTRLSSLEEFKNKIFHLGDIAFIQDTEFFGYVYPNEIKTPYKEKVLVSEITSNFDEPNKDTFVIQNYKTQFEDLFQRITSTTQSLQYASGEYARAATIVEPNGTIKPETLQNSIALNSQLVFSAQNEAILQDSTGLTVTDSTDPSKKTKVTSGGIFITTDGGNTWKNAVRGEGISTQYLTSGIVNTGKVSIMDGAFETFRWDSSGINAYNGTTTDGGINLGKFVRFDRYGIYGINAGADSYDPYKKSQDPESPIHDPQEIIWDEASFGMTWDGFFVKNHQGGGLVEVSSKNDIQVLDKDDHARVKIGRLSGAGTDANPYIYGIRISDNSGAVMETDDSGNLWLKKRLSISSSDQDYSVGIGYLSGYKGTGNNKIYEVINVTSNKNGDEKHFIVYEDGSMKATSGEFTGTIHATGGTIGNMTIDEVQQSAYRVVIDSDSGTIFKNGEGTKRLTATLYKGGDAITTGVTYSWYKKEGNLWAIISGENNSYIDVTAGGATDATFLYKCNINYTPT